MNKQANLNLQETSWENVSTFVDSQGNIVSLDGGRLVLDQEKSASRHRSEFHFKSVFFLTSFSVKIKPSVSLNKCQSTVGVRCIQPPDVFLLTPIVNKSCNIECCVNKMLQIIKNMMFCQGLELELSMFRRTTISGQHVLI